MHLHFSSMEVTGALSDAAKKRIESTDGRPLFLANWIQAVFIHYETEPDILQNEVPFELDLRDGRAYVSLVAFTMKRMRLGFASGLSEWMLRPLSNHGFLNVRTYVKRGDESGIYFLAEWLSNRLSIPLGPVAFGLPYRFGRLDYRHGLDLVCGDVSSKDGSEKLSYRAEMNPQIEFQPCAAGSLDEFLMERYTAFTEWHGQTRFFRVWHPPWPQVPLPRIEVQQSSLLATTGQWIEHAELIEANFSTGVHNVWMGWPRHTEFKS